MDHAIERPETTVWGEIDGRPITFPMEVKRFDAATLLFTVDARAAEALIPGDDFEPIVTEGTAQMVVAACDYHDNPWGDYLELNLGFLARPVGAPEPTTGSFVYRMPVDQEFTCRAGNAVMGFPKTVENLSTDRVDGRIVFAWHREEQLVMSISFSAVDGSGPGDRVVTDSYSYLDGRPFATELAMDMGAGVVDPASVRIELGDDPVSDELRALGLPKVPDFVTWGTDRSAVFQHGRPVIPVP